MRCRLRPPISGMLQWWHGRSSARPPWFESGSRARNPAGRAQAGDGQLRHSDSSGHHARPRDGSRLAHLDGARERAALGTCIRTRLHRGHFHFRLPCRCALQFLHRDSATLAGHVLLAGRFSFEGYAPPIPSNSTSKMSVARRNHRGASAISITMFDGHTNWDFHPPSSLDPSVQQGALDSEGIEPAHFACTSCPNSRSVHQSAAVVDLHGVRDLGRSARTSFQFRDKRDRSRS